MGPIKVGELGFSPFCPASCPPSYKDIFKTSSVIKLSVPEDPLGNNYFFEILFTQNVTLLLLDYNQVSCFFDFDITLRRKIVTFNTEIVQHPLYKRKRKTELITCVFLRMSIAKPATNRFIVSDVLFLSGDVQRLMR